METGALFALWKIEGTAQPLSVQDQVLVVHGKRPFSPE